MNGYNAPLGKNLESACKAWKAQQDAKAEREEREAYLKKMDAAWEAYLDNLAEPRDMIED